MVGLVLPAAGRGQRFGSSENKLWARLQGRSILDWTINVFQQHQEIDEIIVVAAPDEIERVTAECAAYPKVAKVVAGGASRSESVRFGLAALSEKCDVVLVHDAARPAVSHLLISQIIDASRRSGAAIPGLKISDTIKSVDSDSNVTSTIDRDMLRSVQTPQGARRDWLEMAYSCVPENQPATDEAGLLELAGYPVRVIPGETTNIKVTVAEDLVRVGEIMGLESNMQIRTGLGYDVHSLAEGRELWLGGVNIPHHCGLNGHSDADVLLHAVCDALLGAAGMGDIGVLFPDTDAKHKDRASTEFLAEVQLRLRAANWSVVNVDVALLAEEPRVMPYSGEMKVIISTALGVSLDAVNIKATTSEKMGFVGHKEGMACWAVATIQK